MDVVSVDVDSVVLLLYELVVSSVTVDCRVELVLVDVSWTVLDSLVEVSSDAVDVLVSRTVD